LRVAGSPRKRKPRTLARSTRQSKSKSKSQKVASANTSARWLRYWHALGPGLVTGASDDDPSGIATYAQAGARSGLSFLWTALLTFPLMAAVQEICDRTALATGCGLGELAAKRFERTGRTILAFLLVILIVANALNVSADLVAVGSGMNLLHAGPTWIWAIIAGALITTMLALDSFDRLAVIFKVLCASLLTYIVVAIMVTHQWITLLKSTFVPHIEFTNSYLALLVAILGTTISPYLFFWQSAHRLEEMREEPAGGSKPKPLKRVSRSQANLKQRTSRMDVFSGMAFSNVVMFAIIASAAETLHAHHHTNIQSAAQAAQALQPLAGHFASLVFALGFIGSGLLATPVLAGSASIGIADLFGQRWGFSRSITRAPLFYSLVALGTIGGTLLSLVHVNPIKLLVLVAVINGVTAAPFLIVVMRVSSDRALMGRFVNGKLATTLGWLTVVVMTGAAVALFASGGISL
jgi:NRAMP (natural resistance-associated macrophage protein)-like metal ion transporter